jgi:hypothetical protein
LYLSRIVVGLAVGRLRLRSAVTGFGAWVGAPALGLVVLQMAFQIPYAGLISRLVVACLGLGVAALFARRLDQTRRLAG